MTVPLQRNVSPKDNPTSTACRDCPVRTLSLCAALSDEEIVQVEHFRRRRSVAATEQLAWEGASGSLLATVREGVVAMTASTANGQEQIVGLAFAGDFVGRPFGHGTGFGIRPLGRAEICVFPRDTFDKLAREHRELGHRLLVHTLDQLESTRNGLRLLSNATARQKMAAFLLDMSKRKSIALARADGAYLRLPFSRQQIAQIVGLTIETVSRQFTSMRTAGLLSLPGRREVEIHELRRMGCEAGGA